MTLQIIFGAFVIVAGINSLLIWSRLRRQGRLRTDASGHQAGYRDLMRISRGVVLVGAIAVITGILT